VSASPTPLLGLTVRERVAIVTIQHPPANTWTRDSLSRIEKLVETLDAETAQRIDLAEEVVEPGQARRRALELADKVTNHSPIYVAASDRHVQTARFGNLTQAYSRGREAVVDLFDRTDTTEGVQAFFDKRKPQRQNR
jgi:enoyl-CoA hydratase/carnithine racemase